MNGRPVPRLNAALSILAVALLVVGLIEAVATGLLVAGSGIVESQPVITSQTTLWTLWLAVVLTVLTDGIHQSVRYLVAIGALLAASFRAGLYVVAWDGILEGEDPAVTVLRTVPRLVGPLLLALWALVDALRRREAARFAADTATALGPVLRPVTGPPPLAAVRASSAGHSPVPSPAELHEQGWKRAGSPWPRKVEDDPDGTLIRPPRRRAAH
jgi:hypothetical protein